MLNELIRLSEALPDAPPARLVNLIDPATCPGITGAKVRAWLEEANSWDEEAARLSPAVLRSDLEAAA